MSGFDSSRGIAQLAKILDSRIGAVGQNGQVLELGTIQGNYSLKTDTFQHPIPQSSYHVCRSLAIGRPGEAICAAGVPIPEKLRSLAPGDRVLVAWVGSEPVVIDIVVSAQNL